MKARLIVAVGFLCSLILMGLMLAPLAGQLNGYNPWLDSNDDGLIDVLDLQALGAAYGSSGAPLNKMALAYDSGWLNISDLQGQNVAVTHNLNLATDFVQTIYGKTLPESEVHQTCFDWTGYAPGWNASYTSGLPMYIPENRRSYAKSVVQTSDGGYAMAGFALAYVDPTFKQLFWLVKTDAAGNHVWNKTYENTGDDYAYSVVQTSDGGYALAGYTLDVGGFYDVWLVKTYANGTMQWNQTYGGAGNDYGYSVIQTRDGGDGGLAIAGTTSSYGAGGSDFWLVKTDSDGNHQWNKTYGGADYDEARSVVQTADDGYAMAGTWGYALGEAWLVKVDKFGNHQWNQTYVSHFSTEDDAYSLVETRDGYALAGSSYQGGGEPYDYDFWLVKTDASGTHQWNKTYRSGPDYDCAYSLVQTADGGYAMAGCANSAIVAHRYPESGQVPYYTDCWLVKTDSAGNVQWNRTFGEKGQNAIEVALSMVMTADGGFAIAGWDRPYLNDNGWLVKTDAFGLCVRADVIEVGLAVVAITANALTLYRGRIDPYWNYVRVRIWLVKQNP